ncbi:cytochrome C oxidase subunit II [Granulicella sp. 5B5]|uniref:cytochrome c oxidase subunit II n=1 Tax=Granulicella sp. 5B5 TaxID=1617967 RepID=UPI0015F6B208|nr:cytochrome C oxidase subunit II [Granulicella sp. 5B5]QMV17408.1 cytochrome C oxidase subunit II [Granulicella sp. 5B5]
MASLQTSDVVRWGWFLPRDAALHGPALDAHLMLNLWIVLGLAVLAHGLLLVGVMVRRRRAKLPVVMLEYLPLLALTALFAWLATKSEQLWASQRYVGADPAAMQVEVTGEQFAWYFRYPGVDAAFGRTKLPLVSAAEGNSLGIDPTDPKGKDDIVTSQLVLPAGREVDLTLRSLDVIHGFSAPEMRLKQNAVPGQTAHIHFTPTVPGEYAILCTQVCGLGHYRMQSVLRVLPAKEFDAWLTQRELAKARFESEVSR